MSSKYAISLASISIALTRFALRAACYSHNGQERSAYKALLLNTVAVGQMYMTNDRMDGYTSLPWGYNSVSQCGAHARQTVMPAATS